MSRPSASGEHRVPGQVEERVQVGFSRFLGKYARGV